ncbi:MAG: hypothetical protein HQM16_14665 [Deltaproteobacteria bacterium]|nr:hypothetical protein [Deltaproteobacteria bacterium]
MSKWLVNYTLLLCVLIINLGCGGSPGTDGPGASASESAPGGTEPTAICEIKERLYGAWVIKKDTSGGVKSVGQKMLFGFYGRHKLSAGELYEGYSSGFVAHGVYSIKDENTMTIKYISYTNDNVNVTEQFKSEESTDEENIEYELNTDSLVLKNEKGYELHLIRDEGEDRYYLFGTNNPYWFDGVCDDTVLDGYEWAQDKSCVFEEILGEWHVVNPVIQEGVSISAFYFDYDAYDEVNISNIPEFIFRIRVIKDPDKEKNDPDYFTHYEYFEGEKHGDFAIEEDGKLRLKFDDDLFGYKEGEDVVFGVEFAANNMTLISKKGRKFYLVHEPNSGKSMSDAARYEDGVCEIHPEPGCPAERLVARWTIAQYYKDNFSTDKFALYGILTDEEFINLQSIEFYSDGTAKFLNANNQVIVQRKYQLKDVENTMTWELAFLAEPDDYIDDPITFMVRVSSGSLVMMPFNPGYFSYDDEQLVLTRSQSLPLDQPVTCVETQD